MPGRSEKLNPDLEKPALNPAIETTGLTKRFPVNQGWRSWLASGAHGSPVVDHVNLQINPGVLFGLVGPNGAGKTTLIKMLSTLILPSSGTARVNGISLDRDLEIKKTIGLVTSDERSFYWRLTGRQNLAFFAALQHMPKVQIKERIGEVLSLVGLEVDADQRFSTYSTGMRQRLSIARALLSRPRLLFLDEPTKGLDPLAIQAFHQLIRKELVDLQGITVFLTSHWLAEIEQLCDLIAIMNQGRILACGTMPELRRELGLFDHYRLTIKDTTEPLLAALRRQSPAILLNPSGDGITGLEFNSSDGSNHLHQILDLVREHEGNLVSLNTEESSLETIFNRFLGQSPAGEARSADQEQARPNSKVSGEPQDRIKPSSKNRRISLQNTVTVFRAFLRRDFYEEVSYRFSFLLQFVSVFVSAAVFYYIASLLGAAAAPFLEPYGVNYFAFVLIGIAFVGYFNVGLSSFASSLRQAQTTGTLEAMLTTPTNISTIIVSSSFWSYLLTTLRVAVYLIIGGVFLGVDLSHGNYLVAFLVLVLTVIAFSSLGILAASFIMVIKRGDPITWLFTAVASFVGGVYFPINILPGWIQVLAYLFPITYALRAMRLALLQGATLRQLLPDLMALAIFGLLLLPTSLLAFRLAVQKAKVDGSLTHY